MTHEIVAYAKVIDNEIVENNRVLPFSTETTSFGVNTPLEVMKEFGYLPVVGTEPTYDASTHRVNGVSYVIDTDKVIKTYEIVEITQEELLNKAKDEMMLVVENLIQSEITKYNEANMVAFKDIDACAKYTNIPTYTHYQFCVSVITWQTEVWETARKIQSDVLGGLRTMPTIDEFVDELPKYA